VQADEAVVKTYRLAKLKFGAERQKFAREQARRLDGKVSGRDHLYHAYLWQYAGDWGRAAESFRAYLQQAEKSSANRVRAMVQRTRSLVEARVWESVQPAAEKFLAAYPGHEQTGRVLFYLGRAHRMSGRLEKALEAFRRGARAKHAHAPYEVADCLVQLGRYAEAKKAVAKAGGGLNAATLARALPNLGQPLPVLPLDHWVGGRRIVMAELRRRPVIFGFWSTKSTTTKAITHKAMNGWTAEFKGRLWIVGPTTYAQFDPYRMVTNPDMGQDEERNWVTTWHGEYALRYRLVLLTDDSLHKLCGIEDAKFPPLPCFALTDEDSNLRYVRVGGSAWALEATEAMVRRLAKAAGG